MVFLSRRQADRWVRADLRSSRIGGPEEIYVPQLPRQQHGRLGGRLLTHSQVLGAYMEVSWCIGLHLYHTTSFSFLFFLIIPLIFCLFKFSVNLRWELSKWNAFGYSGSLNFLSFHGWPPDSVEQGCFQINWPQKKSNYAQIIPLLSSYPPSSIQLYPACSIHPIQLDELSIFKISSWYICLKIRCPWGTSQRIY